MPSFIRSAFGRSSNDDDRVTAVDAPQENGDQEKSGVTTAATDKSGIPADANILDEESKQNPNPEAQKGVYDMEAITLTWSRWALVAVFLNMWCLYFVNAMQSEIVGDLIPYITSKWDSHSLLNVIYVVSDTMTAACYMPLAKIMDMWGRAEGFFSMIVIATVGIIIMAVANNLPAFCAGYVFYNLGFGGMTYCVDVITADSSLLRSRGLAYAFTSSPYIITAFAGPKAAQDALDGMGMKWGIGLFAFILPVVASPLFFILKSTLRKAGIVRPKSGRTWYQSIYWYIVELDLVGLFFFSAGLTLFFIPFDLAGSAPSSWATDYIITMIVIGFCMLFVFAGWEIWCAPRPLLPYNLLRDRTVLGACLLDATYQIAYYCWDNYFTSFLRVVDGLSVSQAGYINNTFDVVGGVLLLGVGVIIRKTGRFHWMLWVSVPLYMVAQGLMIYFRRPDQSYGYQVMCQVFISIGGSVFIIIEQLSILAAVDHQHVASALALLNVVGTIGDGMGGTISGAIWQNTFPNALRRWLPESAMDNFYDIYEDIDTQLSYAKGTATRTAIDKAYAYAQSRMLAVGTGIMVLCFIWTLMIRNMDLRKMPQVKGMVF
ncbi:hypothetical protein ASPZODRAFT_76468 [Penicilliopsis zonata CBS 506.65]|uniref:Major facilitator superfamily (MFS) profile domain-containing protein n=1 Tax=Penicilliopsis zonata CBS 506.65 TaxID=1073090 RepID=A0A1L9S657_9EURO|nr:hypothetical protein ASPZODRAFT_76468 [Penicilliopsis zonata CBS 506.65]OJJ42623.1 hypothetical protein ASPZODRAFT_76468 [Penicilliopsis zonata CBS 506.65]